MATELTPWEKQILALGAKGLQYDEIALQTKSTKAAVRSRLQQVYNKLGAFSMAEAVDFAQQRGIIK